jgi:hypothetical protein
LIARELAARDQPTDHPGTTRKFIDALCASTGIDLEASE